jgi:hypothetical protein
MRVNGAAGLSPDKDITVALIAGLAPRLARLPHDVPDQDLSIPLNRMPTRPRSGYVMDLTPTKHDTEPLTTP